MLLTLFLEILFSFFASFGIFMLFYLIFAKSYRNCKRNEETENQFDDEDSDD